MNGKIRRSAAAAAARLPRLTDIREHSWLIGLIAGGLIAAWTAR